MISDNFLEKKNSIRILKNYLRRVDRIIKHLDTEQKDEIRLELKSHIYESMTEDKGDEEVSRLLNALDKLGDPEEFLVPILSQKLLAEGVSTLSPAKILKGLYYKVFVSIYDMFISLIFGLGYLVAFILLVMSLLKVFFPAHIGLFINSEKSWSFGIISGGNVGTEILGYWIIPIGFAASFLVYFLITKVLKSVVGRR